MIDFTTLQGLTIPEGVVTQITDESGRVIWAAGGGKVILEVEKITSDTYAGETTYTGEQFILLDIYPKTNGTVNVTYGGLTKTITDTSGAQFPNAQQVFFGTFNGVTDSVETAASGTLTIEGDYRGVGCSEYTATSKGGSKDCSCITAVNSLGESSIIPDDAFYQCHLESIKLPNSILSIGRSAFTACPIPKLRIPSSVESISDQAFYANGKLCELVLCDGLKTIGDLAFGGALENSLSTTVEIPASVENIGDNPFHARTGKNIISVHKENKAYKIDGNCLIEVSTNRLVSGFQDSVIPSYITRIGVSAFMYQIALQNITIPENVSAIGDGAFYNCDLREVVILAEIPPIYEYNNFSIFEANDNLISITVPFGCGDTYKTTEYWKTYADKIVEAS